MKKINLKRAIQLPNAQKTILRPGVHNIQDDIFAHWFIQGQIASGDITVIDEGIKPNVLPSTSSKVFVEVKPEPAPVATPTNVEVEEILPKEEPVYVEPLEPDKVEVVVEPVKEEISIQEPVEEKPVEKVKKIIRRKKKS